MLFAKRAFFTAALIGPFLVAPLFLLEAKVGAMFPPAVTHPEFYYGFAAIALVWQFAYFVISTDPVRFRSFMPVALLAKLSFVATMAALLIAGRAEAAIAAAALPDLIFVALFAAAWAKTPRA